VSDTCGMCTGVRNECIILGIKPQGKRSLGILGSRLEDNIKKDFK
jgi:hypothetical protein